jgi:hypothetical protein
VLLAHMSYTGNRTKGPQKWMGVTYPKAKRQEEGSCVARAHLAGAGSAYMTAQWTVALGRTHRHWPKVPFEADRQES